MHVLVARYGRWLGGARLILAAIATACSGEPGGGAPPLGVGDGGADQDAEIRDDGAVHAPLDAGDASDQQPPPDCTPRFDALDTSCQVHEDCVRVVQTDCFHSGSGTSIVRGIARDAVADFEALALECDLVTPATSDERCPGEGGGLADEVAQEGELEHTSLWPIVVRCIAGQCRSLRTQCEPDLCGNGEIDGCLVTDSASGGAFTPHPLSDSPDAREECDGAKFAGRTCQGDGFGSGAMQCVASVCALDDSACSACLEPAGALTACVGDVLDGLNPSTDGDVAIASSATEIAVALVQQPSVRFVRYNATLERIGEVSFRISDDDTLWLSRPLLAPYPGGWIVALDVAQLVIGQGIISEDLEVHALNPDGSHARFIGKLSRARGSRLVARAGAAPLLLALRPTVTGDPMSSAVAIADDASGFGTITDLGAAVVLDAVVAGEGYLVALQSTATAIALQRLGSDGASVGSAVQHAAPVIDHALISDGTLVRMLYTENGQRVIVGLTEEGAAAGPAQPIAAGQPSLGTRVIVRGTELFATEAMGPDTLLLRFDSALQRTTIATVARHPTSGLPLALFAFGEQVVVAISGQSGAAPSALTLAAIAP